MISSQTSWFLTGGRIYTMGPHRLVDSILILEGKVSLVGSEDFLRQYVPPGVPELNLKGKSVFPGFCDSHMHFLGYAMSFRRVNLHGVKTLEEALSRVADAVSRARPGAWVTGGGWDKSLWGGFPSRYDLDRVAPENPVVLSSKDGHSSWLNSMALRLCGLDRNTPDPDGGSLLRDERGELTGIVQDRAQELVSKFVPEPAVEEKLQACADAVPRLWKLGITAAHVSEDLTFMGIARKLHDEYDLPFRFAIMPYSGALPVLESLGIRQGYGDDWVWLAQIKMFKDGSLGSSTALLFESYEHLPGYCGLEVTTDDQLSNLLERCVETGFGAAVHAIGDKAVSKTLDTIERYIARSAARGIRHRIEHAQMVRKEDLPRFSRFNVIASVQPSHVVADRYMADREWGQRSRQAYPFASLKKNGAMLVFGSDAPVEVPDPLFGIHCAVNRSLPGEGPELQWHPEEKVPVIEAIEAYTRNPAYAAGRENTLGELEPGKWADFVVLGADPTQVPEHEIWAIPVEAVCVGGRFVIGP
ncbi:MAG: amidohydrolase [Firmicutes bacterium]|nr:amidohydrolase [Candidatus Fermentithermobacillaceae bacterium]